MTFEKDLTIKLSIRSLFEIYIQIARARCETKNAEMLHLIDRNLGHTRISSYSLQLAGKPSIKPLAEKRANKVFVMYAEIKTFEKSIWAKKYGSSHAKKQAVEIELNAQNSFMLREKDKKNSNFGRAIN